MSRACEVDLDNLELFDAQEQLGSDPFAHDASLSHILAFAQLVLLRLFTLSEGHRGISFCSYSVLFGLSL